MRVHTLETSYELSGMEYSHIDKEIKKSKFASKYCTYNLKKKLFSGLSKNGITICIYGIEIPNAVTYAGGYGLRFALLYEINPTRIFDHGNYVGLFDVDRLPDIIEVVNSLLKSVSDSLPKLEHCKLHRFDFCTNIEMPDHQLVADAIKLINRSVCNRGYYQHMKHNYGRLEYPTLEATFTRKRDMEVSIYDKKEQLKSENLPHNNCSDILRCEVRCFRDYIKSLCKKYGLANRSVTEFFAKAAEIGEYVFRHNLAKLSLDGDFYRLSAIKKIVEESNKQSEIKRRMVYIAEEAATRRDIKTVLRDMDRGEVKWLEHHFKDLHMSPMPIPVHSALSDGINLLKLCLSDDRK